jgi:hypothetical protein
MFITEQTHQLTQTLHWDYSVIWFEVLMAVTLTSTIVWDVILCSLVEVHQHFRWKYCLYLQDWIVCQANNQSVLTLSPAVHHYWQQPLDMTDLTVPNGRCYIASAQSILKTLPPTSSIVACISLVMDMCLSCHYLAVDNFFWLHYPSLSAVMSQ